MRFWISTCLLQDTILLNIKSFGSKIILLWSKLSRYPVNETTGNITICTPTPPFPTLLQSGHFYYIFYTYSSWYISKNCWKYFNEKKILSIRYQRWSNLDVFFRLFLLNLEMIWLSLNLASSVFLFFSHFAVFFFSYLLPRPTWAFILN